MKKDYIKFHFRLAYRKCESCIKDTENKYNIHDFEQRIDEILLIYSNMFNVSVNDAKKELSDVVVLEDEA